MKHAIRKIHFIGIGGSGMSGIAEVLLNLGYQISGSDLADSATLHRLSALGIATHVGHSAANVKDADAVVTSTAVKSWPLQEPTAKLPPPVWWPVCWPRRASIPLL
jgi:UDP-N-acetylmuramate--alanine ligase